MTSTQVETSLRVGHGPAQQSANRYLNVGIRVNPGQIASDGKVLAMTFPKDERGNLLRLVIMIIGTNLRRIATGAKAPSQ